MRLRGTTRVELQDARLLSLVQHCAIAQRGEACLRPNVGSLARGDRPRGRGTAGRMIEQDTLRRLYKAICGAIVRLSTRPPIAVNLST